MGYIRDDEDWYAANGDNRSRSERASDLRRQADNARCPDSIRDELIREAKRNERRSDYGKPE